MVKAWDLKDLEGKLAPQVVPVLFKWIGESAALEAANGSPILAVLPGVLDAALPAVLDALAKVIASQP